MQAVKNPVALNLASEVKKTVSRNDVVNDTLNRYDELLQLQNFFRRKEQKVAEQVAASAEQRTAEKMIITAFQANAPVEVIEAMKENVGITDARLAELKIQAATS